MLKLMDQIKKKRANKKRKISMNEPNERWN